ncbi:hypothetical protein E8E14_014019 [Neopestalotiopsis sp. 37M]|nr:hypothetical protein E8E14_014019 [Neopestalotiopsis sp. 37M]
MSSRRQPARQARSNPSRSSLLAGSIAGRDAHGHDQPIDIFPAITHFTDAITSLPKDLVRHFTLLKEVDAKIFQPEERLFQLVGDALKSEPPAPRPTTDGSGSAAPTPAPMSAQNSVNGSLPTAPSNDPSYNVAIYSPENVPRRQLFRETAFKIQEMLVSLEEKNHVISTANEALSKQLARIDNIWPHLEGEYSDEAKWGSNTHWAYPENRIKASATERSRRDGASAITAAAQQLAEEAAARTEARKQAVAAKKKQHQDSDADADHEKKNEPAKKSGTKSSRKAAEAAAPVGLGITTETNGNPPPKKRKTENKESKEKPANIGGQPMERALSGVFGSSSSNTNANSTASKAKTSSPRATPAPDAAASKKRKALPTVNGGAQPKKSKNALPAALSPSVTTSPILPNFDPRTIGRGSPVPPAPAARPATSRARNNSTASNLAQRPSSSASNKPNGVILPVPEVMPAPSGRVVTEVKPTTKETPVPVKVESTPKEDVPQPIAPPAAVQSRSRKNSVVKEQDTEPKNDTAQVTPQMATPLVTTKSGRASKPSTPALAAFPESARPARSSRNTQASGAKRSHKKGASLQAALAAAAQAADDDANSSGQGDDEGDIDANEPRYCYCNNVSYGEMVACDAVDCEKEWFHLGCVGLRSAPSSSTKWYCDNCKNRMKNGGKKVNGR